MIIIGHKLGLAQHNRKMVVNKGMEMTCHNTLRVCILLSVGTFMGANGYLIIIKTSDARRIRLVKSIFLTMNARLHTL